MDVTTVNIVLSKWTARPETLWAPPAPKGCWLRARPSPKAASAPQLRSPGAKLFKTQPDGLWLFMNPPEFCDAIVVEVCQAIPNLNDKRSRYMPAVHSIVADIPPAWLLSKIPIQGGGERCVWQAAETISSKPGDGFILPVRYLRVLYALREADYDKWVPNHTPTGYEYFCIDESLRSFRAPKMQEFLRQMSVSKQFYTKPYR